MAAAAEGSRPSNHDPRHSDAQSVHQLHPYRHQQRSIGTSSNEQKLPSLATIGEFVDIVCTKSHANAMQAKQLPAVVQLLRAASCAVQKGQHTKGDDIPLKELYPEEDIWIKQQLPSDMQSLQLQPGSNSNARWLFGFSRTREGLGVKQDSKEQYIMEEGGTAVEVTSNYNFPGPDKREGRGPKAVPGLPGLYCLLRTGHRALCMSEASNNRGAASSAAAAAATTASCRWTGTERVMKLTVYVDTNDSTQTPATAAAAGSSSSATQQQQQQEPQLKAPYWTEIEQYQHKLQGCVALYIFTGRLADGDQPLPQLQQPSSMLNSAVVAVPASPTPSHSSNFLPGLHELITPDVTSPAATAAAAAAAAAVPHAAAVGMVAPAMPVSSNTPHKQHQQQQGTTAVAPPDCHHASTAAPHGPYMSLLLSNSFAPPCGEQLQQNINASIADPNASAEEEAVATTTGGFRTVGSTPAAAAAALQMPTAAAAPMQVSFWENLGLLQRNTALQQAAAAAVSPGSPAHAAAAAGRPTTPLIPAAAAAGSPSGSGSVMLQRLPPRQQSNLMRNYAAVARSLRHQLLNVFAGCYGDSSMQQLHMLLDTAQQHNAAVLAAEARQGFDCSGSKEAEVFVSLADLIEPDRCRTALHLLVSDLPVHVDATDDAAFMQRVQHPGHYRRLAAVATTSAYQPMPSAAAAVAGAGTAGGMNLAGSVRSQLLNVLKHVIINGWQSAHSSRSSAGNSSSSSSVKPRGLEARGIEGWMQFLTVRNCAGATAFHTSNHFCIPEAVEFFMREPCLTLDMLTDVTPRGGRMFYHIIAREVKSRRRAMHSSPGGHDITKHHSALQLQLIEMANRIQQQQQCCLEQQEFNPCEEFLCEADTASADEGGAVTAGCAPPAKRARLPQLQAGLQRWSPSVLQQLHDTYLFHIKKPGKKQPTYDAEWLDGVVENVFGFKIQHCI